MFYICIMKTKTLLTLLKIADNALESIVNSPDNFGKSYATYCIVTDTILPRCLNHWRRKNLFYDWRVIAAKCDPNTEQIFTDAEDRVKANKNIHRFSTDRTMWDVERQIRKNN